MNSNYKVGDVFEGSRGKMKLIKDFLPSPKQLALKTEPKKIKVTLTLEQSSVEFFKAQAKKFGGSYQRMMRNLLSDYAKKIGDIQ